MGNRPLHDPYQEILILLRAAVRLIRSDLGAGRSLGLDFGGHGLAAVSDALQELVAAVIAAEVTDT